MEWTPEQRRAIEEIRSWVHDRSGSILSLSGAAGTGKTTILNAIKNDLPSSTLWTALTGKAALRVRELVNVPATTLHKVLYETPDKDDHGQLHFNQLRNPEGTSHLVIDESSLVTPKIYQDLRTWSSLGVNILFVGDGYQLPPILSKKEEKEYGEDFSIFREVPGPSLSKVMRSGDDLVKIAERLRYEEQLPDSAGPYEYLEILDPNLHAIESYLEDPDDHMLITWTNEYRMKTNRKIRRILGYKGKYPHYGEPVLVCQNGRHMLNGEIHRVKEVVHGGNMGPLKTNFLRTKEARDEDAQLVSLEGRKEFMDGFMPWIKDWQGYLELVEQSMHGEPVPITYGYVATAHKCQGSEFRRVTLFLDDDDLHNPYFNKPTYLPDGNTMNFASRFIYTALTRARERVTVIIGT